MRRLIPLGRALLLGLLLVLLNTGISAAQDPTPGILITEVLAANARTVADDRGRYTDWIELHNPTDTPIPLAGYTITDDPTEPDKWRLPFTTLVPGAFLVVWASGANRVGPEGWHTNFRLSRGGEYVGLFGPDGQVVDAVTFGEQEVDVSLGRLGTVSSAWVAFSTATPGAANTPRPRAVPGAPPVIVTPGSGHFAGPVTVQLYTPVPGSLLYYTLDGSNPTVGGQEYTAPLEVTETTVLRAVALDEGVSVSSVTTVTYLVGESNSLPALSLVTDPSHLWDEATGIYTNPQERGRRWERPVTAEWLSSEGGLGFSVGAGLRIHGGWGRTTAKQSFRLYFRGEYGPRELAYPLFRDEKGQTYDRLVLRAGRGSLYVQDQLVRDLHGAMGQVAARGRWVEVYLNGVYWGLYNLTERIDDAFLTNHFDHYDWDVVHGGGYEAWDVFVDWITSTDMSVVAHYEQGVQQLDIENFTSFIILRLWARDTDWGTSNWYAARMRDSPDARWRLFVWDAEAVLGLVDYPSNQEVIGVGMAGPLIPILASLLASPQYQAYLAAQVEHHLTGALATETVRGHLAVLGAAVRPAIAAEAARWRPEQKLDVAVAQWEAALQRVSDALEATAQQLRQLIDLETLQHLIPSLVLPANPALLPPDTRVALLVHQPDELSEGDVAVVDHLAARGAMVTVIGTHEERPHEPGVVDASHDLLLVSSSVRLLDRVVRYAQTTTPLIFWEPRLLAESRVPLAPRGGTRPEQTDIRIVDTDHPITAGLPPDQPLRVVRQPATFSVAYPPSGPGVQVLARHVIGRDAALMVTEVGTELAHGQQAQARTVFWFGHHDTFHRSTDTAWLLFDRVVNWALGLTPDDGA